MNAYAYRLTARQRALGALLAVLVVVAGCAAACQDQAAPWVYEADSIGVQYAVSAPTSGVWNAQVGASIASCPFDGCVPPAVDMAARARAGRLPRVVLELGENDAVGGWTAADVRAWSAALDGLPNDGCAVLVLPYSVSLRAADVNAARAWMAKAPGRWGNVHTVDWKPYALRPGVLGPDGVHLAWLDGSAGGKVTAAAVDAFGDMLAAARQRCPA